MEEYKSITKEQIWQFIQMGDEEFSLEDFRRRYYISAESANFYVAIKHLMDERKIKRIGRGLYRRVKKVNPVNWYSPNGQKSAIDNFKFPSSHEDYSRFGIEDLVEIFPGDMILISGVSNYGKTGLALNILGENIDLFKHNVVMGSEHTKADGEADPKFVRRIFNMDWCEWVCNDKPKFDLLPVDSDYEDYVVPGALNIIDWISLPGEYFMIDDLTKKIKRMAGDGVIVAVTQKNRASEFSEGGERAERYVDVHLKLDPYGESESLLTIGKVKATKQGQKASGRHWAFRVVHAGANLADIREVVKCHICNGRGQVAGYPCTICKGRKYVDKGD